MQSILDAINEWIKEILIGSIQENLEDDKVDRYSHVHLCQLLYVYWFQYNIFCALYSVFSVWYQYYHSTSVGIAL